MRFIVKVSPWGTVKKHLFIMGLVKKMVLRAPVNFRVRALRSLAEIALNILLTFCIASATLNTVFLVCSFTF